MGLTVSNSNTLSLLSTLNKNTNAQTNVLRQLTTGKRINTGADDPAGLIALSSLNREITAVDSAITSNQRTDSLLNVADAAIGEIQSLLGEIQSIAESSSSGGNLTNAEIAANQAQIDDALTAIDRIVQNTSFNGEKLLDGNYAIQKTGVGTNSDISNVKVYSRSQSSSDTTVTITRNGAADTASATLGFIAGTARTSGTSEIVVAGSLGTATITLASGLTQAEVVTQINQSKDQTGVSAIQGSDNVSLSSTTYGSDAYVSVEVLSGGEINSSYSTSTGDSDTNNNLSDTTRQTGVDATILVNGQSAGVDGLDVSFNSNGLSVDLTLSSSFGTAAGTGTTTFTVNASGGATFQLGTDSNSRATIGIDSLASYNLGGGNGTSKLNELRSGGSVDLNSNVTGALNAIEDAITQVASVRGRIGGFQRFQVGSAINSLSAQKSALTDAASDIGDTDFAVATAELNQQSVLVNSSISLLGLANQQATQILSLLG